jgi:hypothetical protein
MDFFFFFFTEIGTDTVMREHVTEAEHLFRIELERATAINSRFIYWK